MNQKQKHTIFILIFFWSAGAFANPTKLFLIGGGVRPPETLQAFVNSCRPDDGKAQILVVTWASEVPKDVYSDIERDLLAAGAEQVVAALAPPKSADEKSAFLVQFNSASGIFFSGGDQSRAVQALVDQDLVQTIRDLYASGIPIAGTSAGTAMMSSVMMTGDTTPLSDGLGLMPGILLDTHFFKRNRPERLHKALGIHPELLGVGIDEGTSLQITDGVHARVLGPTKVDLMMVTPELHEEILNSNECFDLEKRTREICAE